MKAYVNSSMDNKEMTQIRLQNVSFGYTDPLFENVTLTITENDKIGIVGNNGEGKSTLLKCLVGEIDDFSGQISKPKGMTYGFIEQDVPENLKNLSLYDAIAEKIPSEFRDYTMWRVDIALDTFKAPEDIRNKKISELSGGWQKLALIARSSMTDPDVLLLDEPTNHLDVEKIGVLEEWLKTCMADKPVIIISHDRRFLDSCTNRTLFLRGAQVFDYQYSYTQAKNLLIEDDKALTSQREKELEELTRLQKSAHELRQTGINNHSDAALQKAKQIDKKIERLRLQLTAPVHIEYPRAIQLTNSGSHAKKIITIENVSIHAPHGLKLFHITKFDIAQGDRVVILGKNGAGKSQFIQHLVRAFSNLEASKDHGIRITPSTRLGYIDQHHSTLPLGETMHDYIAGLAKQESQKITRLLIGIGFSYEDHSMKIRDLSQGQRARLNLLALRLSAPNFYIMDEPTNHLDIAGQESLEKEIIEHGASSIFVSHDRAFVNNVGNKFYRITNAKLVQVKSHDLISDKS